MKVYLTKDADGTIYMWDECPEWSAFDECFIPRVTCAYENVTSVFKSTQLSVGECKPIEIHDLII